MFGSTMIYWRSLLATARKAEELSTYRMMSHSASDRRIFDRRRERLARAGWRAVRLTPQPDVRQA
ncbi:MAG: hypothetical protein R3F54_24815 [Alphaproteobacteria bacterium]